MPVEQAMVPSFRLMEEPDRRRAAEAQVKELRQRIDELEAEKKKGWPWRLW